MKLLIDPHGDDGVLFAAFTIMRERPLVLVVFDSYIQAARGANVSLAWRRSETHEALHELWPQGVGVGGIMGDGHLRFLGFRDDQSPQERSLTEYIRELLNFDQVTDIWAPAYEEGGHEQHNLVARACDAFEGRCKVHRYLTYTRAGGKTISKFDRMAKSGPQRISEQVMPRSGEDIARKHRALACFKSQMQLDPRIGCADWFMNDLREYALIDSVERVDDGSEKR